MSVLSQILSSRTRAEIFRLLFGLGERELHLRDIERRTGLAVGTVRGELRKLLRLDLITARRDGNRLYYRANLEHPLYGDIRALVMKTSGLADVLRPRLEDGSIGIAFVFGSVADGSEKAASDVDLFIIGSAGLRALSSRLSGVAEELGREVNPYVLSPEEYRRRKKRGDHFLSRVLAAPKLFLVGTADELESMG
jgi:DNA-binding transcriptional ArsR family regulator